MPELTGVHHLALTVRDLDAAVEWYQRVLGVTKLADMGEGDHRFAVTVAPNGFVIGLHTHAATADEVFAETRVGLDHVGFACTGRAQVEEWMRRLDELGVPHSGIQDVPYGHVLVFRDADNIQLEFFALPG